MSASSPTYPDHTSADFATPTPSPVSAGKTGGSQSTAAKLIEKTGSPEQAKDAIDTAARAQAAPPITKEDFARRWGFASSLEMFEASKPVGDAGAKKKWLLTSLRGGKWLLWNDAEMESAREFASREEALPQVPRASGGDNSEAAKMQG